MKSRPRNLPPLSMSYGGTIVSMNLYGHMPAMSIQTVQAKTDRAEHFYVTSNALQGIYGHDPEPSIAGPEHLLLNVKKKVGGTVSKGLSVPSKIECARPPPLSCR